jgi:hypothetical protein
LPVGFLVFFSGTGFLFLSSIRVSLGLICKQTGLP